MKYVPALPHLETERLQLRWLTEDDAGLMLAIWNDAGFIQHVGDRGIRSLEEAVTALQEGILAIYRDKGMGAYVLTLKDADAPMGICGLFMRENLDWPDIGYSLLPPFRGKGYALEAAQAVRDHAARHMHLSRLLAIVSPENTRSVQLLEKLGMSAGERIRMPGEDDHVTIYGMDLG